MFRRYSANDIIAALILDAVLVIAALQIAVYIRPFFNPYPFVKEISRPVQLDLQVYFLAGLSWVINLFYGGVYHPRRNLSFKDELKNLSLASLFAGASLAGILYLTFRDVSRFLFVLFMLLAFILLLAWRLIPWLLMSSGIRVRIPRRTIIVGAGEVGSDVRQQLDENPQFQHEFWGFLDDDPDKIDTNPDIIGSCGEIREIINENQIDDVIVALPRRAYNRVDQLVKETIDLPVRFWVIPHYFSLVLHRAEIEEFGGIPMLNLRAPALRTYQSISKRIFDIILALILSPVVGVVSAFIALAILIEGKGPVFFVQSRVGENGKIFNMYKFRTMVVDADQKLKELVKRDGQDRPIYKRPDDPRVTQLGKILRRTSLDELPQVLNVIKGEMSFVGPRPELPELVETYQRWQRERFSTPPGITGWWQVTGRSDRPMHLHTEDDLYYIQNYSLWLDLRILLLTLKAVIRGKGAY